MPGSPLDHLRYAGPILAAQAWWKRRRRRVHFAGPAAPGRCAICAGERLRLHDARNPREGIVCLDCGSVPRQRAVVTTLQSLVTAGCRVHESSPSLCTFHWLRRRTRAFVGSYYWPERRSGARVGAMHNIDLGDQPFADGSFDVVVTQDVLEHVPDPRAALREIHRTLRPGGVHVFTVPRAGDRPTTARAELRDGQLHHLLPAEYHRDPIDRRGSLVVTDWGHDLERIVVTAGAATCTATTLCAPELGIVGEVELFVAVTPEPAQQRPVPGR